MDEKERDKILRRPVELVGGKAILSPREGKGMNQDTKTPQSARTEAEPAKTNVTTAANETTGAPVFMIEVESSNLARVGFHHGDVLRVQFKSKTDPPEVFTGDMWDYKGISKGEFTDLVNDDSPGRTYIALTKNRGIKGTKVEGAQ